MRDSDPDVDALLRELKAELVKHSETPHSIERSDFPGRKYQLNDEDLKRLAHKVADLLADRMKGLLMECRERA